MNLRKDSEILSLKDTNRWDLLLLSIGAIVFAFLFSENFIFSSSLDLLPYREVDDYAFQAYLREAHENFKILGLNGYAYGWIFWFPIVILTYPFYFLAEIFGIETPLIVIPRQLSLIMVFLSAYLLYKTASLYSRDKFVIACVTLLFFTFPFVGWISLRFGTIGQVMFLSMLTLYLALRPTDIKASDCYKVALAAAAAGATKLNGLMVCPIATLIILQQYNWKFNSHNIKIWTKSVLIFIVSLLLLGQYDFIETISQIGMIQTNIGGYEGPLKSFKNGITKNFLSLELFILLYVCLSYYIAALFVGGNVNRAKQIFILAGISVPLIVYLIFRVRLGTFYISNYYSVICFLPCLGLLVLNYIKFPFAKFTIGILIVASSLALNYQNINSTAGWTRFSIFENDTKRQEAISIGNELRKIVSPLVLEKNIITLRDYEAPGPYVNMRDFASDHTAFNNMQYTVNNFKGAPDLIGFAKNGPAFFNSKKFNEFIDSIDESQRERYRGHREFIELFLETQNFRGANYTVVKDTKEYLYFIKF